MGTDGSGQVHRSLDSRSLRPLSQETSACLKNKRLLQILKI